MTDVTDVPPPIPAPHPPPWGIWATLGWAVLAMVASSALGFAAVIAVRPTLDANAADLLKDGLLLSISTIASAVAMIAILAPVARGAKWPAGEYLALVKPRRADTVVAFAVLIVFLLGFDGLTYLLGRDIVTPFQVDTYVSARASGSLLLLWVALVIAAPFGEELLFRGFLFRGWVTSERSTLPGILVISALFAVVHVQYDWFGVLQIFLIGLILAWARWQSGSTLLTMALHALINLWATIETALKVDWLS
jgi:CAAX protease family protein